MPNELKGMEKAAAEYDKANRRFTATQALLGCAIEAYSASVASQMHVELLKLDWHAFRGGGSRTELEAELSQDSPILNVFRNIAAFEREYARVVPFCFNSISVYRLRRIWDSPERVRVSKDDLTKIGYKIKRPTGDARKKMIQMLEERDLTPEQLKALLERKST